MHRHNFRIRTEARIKIALAARGGRVRGVVFHTDRGAPSSAADFAEVCRRHGTRRRHGPRRLEI
ncbi:hypothetical protein GCM10010397_83600 [Streptomyces spinoverrucosus]|nr:hypothetical protein GCM10010397_83600 [Streptomyces spinoverrucosus]